MLIFLAVASLMVGAALLILLMPLIGRPTSLRSRVSPAADLVMLYREQMNEVEADVAAGLLPSTRLEEARNELEQRLLTDMPPHSTTDTRVQWHKSRNTAIAVSLSLPLVAGLLYWNLGNPSALTGQAAPQAVARSDEHSTSVEQIGKMVGRLAEKLAANPDNPEGWAMLARSYSALGRHPEAVLAFGRAAALLPDDADLLADYADALAVTMHGKLKGKPMQLVRHALKLDPDNAKALALAGTEAFDRADYRGAIAFWEHAARNAPEGTEFTDALHASLEEAKSLAAGRPAESSPARISESASAPAGRVAGSVSLASSLAAKALPDHKVFIYAQALEGPRMPLAILAAKVADLPLNFVLDDSLSMSPDLKLSSFQQILVTARVSKAGGAMPLPGDLQGRSGPVRLGASKIQIEINEIVK